MSELEEMGIIEEGDFDFTEEAEELE